MIWGRIRERRRRLGLFGGMVASALLWPAITRSGWPSNPGPVLALVALAAGLAWWTTLNPARVAYDLTTPITVATGVLAGPDSVLRVLVLQGILIALVDGVARRRSPFATLANTGIQVTWQAIVAIGLRLLLQRVGDPSVAGVPMMALGLMAVTIVGVTFNWGSVHLAIRYLYGPPSEKPDLELAVQLRDVAASTVLGSTVWLGRISIWLPLIGAALAAMIGFDLVRHTRDRAATLARQLRKRIQQAEERGLAGHSSRVAAMLEHLTAGTDGRSRRRVVAAAWCHGIAVAGRPGRCAGIPADPEHVELVRALPSGLQIERMISSITGGYVGPDASPMAAMIAAACALDSTRHQPAAVQRKHITGLLHISGETLARVSRAEEVLRRQGSVET